MARAPLLPDRCSVGEGGRRCPSPPEFVISVAAADGEYMVGVACAGHRDRVSGRLRAMQEGGEIPAGKVSFSALRPVGTDCVRGGGDGLIRL